MAGWRWWLALALVAFITNLVWENAHGILYAHAIPGWRYLRAAAGDVLLVAVGITAALPLRHRSRMASLVGAAVALAVLAVVVEVHAVANMRWTYTEAMPTIGPVGLSPLLQLPVTGVVSRLAADGLQRFLTSRSRPGSIRP